MLHRRVRSILMCAVAVMSGRLMGQTADVPADYMLIRAHEATTWGQDDTNVMQLTGPVEIRMDGATLFADQAVVWLTPVKGTVIEQERAEVALIGNARLDENGVTRTGAMLQVTGTIRGAVRVTADDRLSRDLSDTPLYQQAASIRPSTVAIQPVTEAATQPAPTTQEQHRVAGAVEPVTFRAPGQLETVTAQDGKLAVVLSGGVTLVQDRKDGSLIELQSDKAVLFTNIEKLTDLQKEGPGPKRLEDTIRSAYLEGDIRIVYTPGSNSRVGEQRMTGHRAYYDFTTDRAVLTDAVLHSTNPKIPVPMIVRADVLRQLSRSENQAEFTADHAVLTTSEFATPSYSLAADKAYIHQVETGDPRLGDVTTYEAKDVTFQAFGVPYFYLPAAAGTVSGDTPLRSIAMGDDSRFGFYGSTTWGLFPTIGKTTPPGLDAEYTVGFWGDRGPGAGIDGKYGGSYVSEPEKDPWSFDGQFTSFFVDDQGKDHFGGGRNDVTPEDEFRGHVLWEHQHFLPGDWQVQLRAGWVSDPTFLEEWVQRDFYSGDPHDVSAYVKKQTDTEALTLLGSLQPNRFVTTSDMMQEQFEVERLPEIGYHRIGDSPFGDNFTFFSDNSLSALQFSRSTASLADLGYQPGTTPGIPSLGVVGATGAPNVPDDQTYRGDFRQELDYPFAMGQLKLVPYVMERYTAYSDSPTGQAQNRFFSGAGTRISTTFWKVDDTAESELFDIHRVRHVVEPEVHVFTSATTVDERDVFIYDEPVDRINDITAAQLALNQTWQTKRGGPGRWRSVDFLTWNVEGDFFSNAPADPELQPVAFRGMFFDSMPEASIPRDAINSDAAWHVSDTFVVMADVAYNLDHSDLATTSLGVAVRRDPRVMYYVGLRYINPLNSTIGTIAMTYELSRKYVLGLSQSYDFSGTNDVYSSAEIQRNFDKFWISVRIYHDAISDQSGIGFMLYPTGLGPRSGATSLSDVFGSQRQY